MIHTLKALILLFSLIIALRGDLFIQGKPIQVDKRVTGSKEIELAPKPQKQPRPKKKPLSALDAKLKNISNKIKEKQEIKGQLINDLKSSRKDSVLDDKISKVTELKEGINKADKFVKGIYKKAKKEGYNK